VDACPKLDLPSGVDVEIQSLIGDEPFELKDLVLKYMPISQASSDNDHKKGSAGHKDKGDDADRYIIHFNLWKQKILHMNKPSGFGLLPVFCPPSRSFSEIGGHLKK